MWIFSLQDVECRLLLLDRVIFIIRFGINIQETETLKSGVCHWANHKLKHKNATKTPPFQENMYLFIPGGFLGRRVGADSDCAGVGRFPHFGAHTAVARRSRG
jgi:hypothetical protein